MASSHRETDQITARMRRLILLVFISSSLAYEVYDNRRRSVETVAVVEEPEPSFLSRIVSEETQARVVESISNWQQIRQRKTPAAWRGSCVRRTERERQCRGS